MFGWIKKKKNKEKKPEKKDKKPEWLLTDHKLTEEDWAEMLATYKRYSKPAVVYKQSKPSAVVPKEITDPSILQKVTQHDPLPEWFINPDIKISPAEQIIMDLLKIYRVEWYREISFHNFKSSEYGYYRFDFFLPACKLVIEYDGKEYHSSDRQVVDSIKDAWCWNNGITVKRFNSKHYYSMATHIDNLMRSHNIRRK